MIDTVSSITFWGTMMYGKTDEITKKRTFELEIDPRKEQNAHKTYNFPQFFFSLKFKRI
jgi:hypothetical protein